MIIQEPKTIFIHIPKTAGTSVESVFKPYVRLNNLVDRHATVHEIKNKLPGVYKDYNKFTIVRNPYERMVSFYFYLKEYNELFRAKWDISFIEWLNNPEKVEIPFNSDWIEKLGYFKNQEEWIDDTVTVIKYENLNKEINDFFNKEINLPLKNNTKHKNYKTYYNKQSFDIVYNRYKKDFEKFNYKKI